MAITGSLTLQGTLLGLPGGSKSPFVAWTITNGVGTITVVDVPTTGVTVTVPTNTTLAIITPPTGNTNALRLNTDTPLRKTLPTVYSPDTTVTSFTLTATGSTISGVEVNLV